jgi:DNA-binding GntR family transcriptional regulator
MDDTGPFEPESVRVAGRIRDDILDGARAPGSRLVERDLAQELGVSRIPVRDAIRLLAAEGLVTARPRTWAVVKEFTDDDFADLHEVRGALERLAFRRAAAGADDAGIARLRDVLEAESAAARDGDPVRARRCAADFHEVVVEISGNALLEELEGVLRSRMRWLMGQHDDLEAVAAEHRALFEAIAARDVDTVEALVDRHLDSGHDLALRHRGGRLRDERPRDR